MRVFVSIINDYESGDEPGIDVFKSEAGVLDAARTFMLGALAKDFIHYTRESFKKSRPELTEWHARVLRTISSGEILDAIDKFNDQDYNEKLSIMIFEKTLLN